MKATHEGLLQQTNMPTTMRLLADDTTKISADNIANGEFQINIQQDVLKLHGRASNDPLTATQDIFLAATSFIGVVLTIGIIRNGFKLVTNSEDSKEIDSVKKNLTKLVIGWLIVISSTLVVYLVQYVAKRA